MTHRRLAAGATFLLPGLAFLCLVPLAGGAQEYALRVGWLVDGTGRAAQTNVILLVRDARIEGVATKLPDPKLRVLDFSGDTAIPGLVDAHGHIAMLGLGEEADERLLNPGNRKEWVLRNARTAVSSGVTTLRDPGTYPWTLALRTEIERVGLRWITAGRQLVKRSPEAYQDEMFLEFDGPKDAAAKVRQLRQEGADFIKLRLTKQRPLPTPEEVRAIVEQAHRLTLLVAVHTDVPNDEAVRLALRAGVDSLEHNAALRVRNPDEIFPQLARRGTVVVAGMGNWEARVDCLSIPPEELIEEPLRSKLAPELRQALVERGRECSERMAGWVKGGFDPDVRRRQALEETGRAHAAGVLLAAGPDTGVDLLPHGRLYKDAYWYAQVGLPIEEVVRIATLNGARAAGREAELGSLEAGKHADIVILRGNLLQDYRRLKDVLLVIRDGRIVFDAAEDARDSE